jgi:hypothetical protein
MDTDSVLTVLLSRRVGSFRIMFDNEQEMKRMLAAFLGTDRFTASEQPDSEGNIQFAVSFHSGTTPSVDTLDQHSFASFFNMHPSDILSITPLNAPK